MISDHTRPEKPRQLEPTVTIGRAHHGNLDAHVAQSSDAIRPVDIDRDATLELKTKFGEKLDSGSEIFYNDADVVHTRLYGVRLGRKRREGSRAAARLPSVRRLLAAGKPRRVINIAVARKLLVALNSMIHNHADWRPASCLLTHFGPR